MQILGIESSCDETAVALYDSTKGLIAHALYSQIGIHAKYGGVVPELASRDHIKKISGLLKQVIHESAVTAKDIDAIAYTAGPGLVGALLVGAGVGRSLAMAWNIPAVAVHHMEGHLLAPMLEEKQPEFPFVALLVSGGHTLLVEVKQAGDYVILGESLDDAVGEAFDKTAKLLGLDYPGGAALAKLALKGDASRFRFPRPMTDRPGLDFSFSGLKTFALNTFQQFENTLPLRQDIAIAFETAVVETLLIKCQRALTQTRYSRLIVAGGVSANLALRERFNSLQAEVFYPKPEFCTDNAAMIAYAGYLKYRSGIVQPLHFQALPRWKITEARQVAD